MRAALNAGTPTIKGRFTMVSTHDGRGVAVPNLARPDEWVGYIEHLPNVVTVYDGEGTESAVILEDSVMTINDPAFRAILQHGEIAQLYRHDPKGAEARAAAGRACLRVGDAMLRARLLDAVDGWEGILGQCIDGTNDGPHGALYEAVDTTLLVNMLRVVCPSTHRVYVHPVPKNDECATAEGARKWIMWGDVPDVET